MIYKNNSNNNQGVKALDQFAVDLTKQASDEKSDSINILKL